ncbi:CDC48 family AAA ATPase [Candidatus Bathyarchaeota archaeon]|nr:CDC48 family AAA ATPase [Candidatus Bathyarchaeota archaeon]
MAREIKLRVAEVSHQRDVGRWKVRIDAKTMEFLEVTPGDVVEIKGKRTTAAVVWPAYPEDTGKNIIRMDGITRKNAGVSINEYVSVRKAVVKEAQSVTLAPVNVTIPGVDQSFYEFIKNRILEAPVVAGDTIQISIFGSAVHFRVTKTIPHGIVAVTSRTNVQVLSEPVPEKAGLLRVTYEDIGGLKEAIQKIREMVELPLRHPELFQRLGIEPPKGVLLYGPPGCGKTLLAKAVANESEANFFSINGPEIMSKFYGESEARLRDMFQKAQENAPSIIFIDEIDAIAPKREEVTGEVERRVVAQLLALMDGLESRGNVIVIGATNRVNALDPALRRPGRFDREIEIGIPDKNGRYEILQIHTRGMPLAEDVNLNRLAEITHGYTGADIAALCREAAMKALRRYLPKINLEEPTIPPEVLEEMVVNMSDFMQAYREITPTAMREVEVEVPTVHWDEIGGLDDVKQQLRESVEWPLKNPKLFENMGIKPPRGVLLYGPPGCGKTLLAKAVATESEANFISIKGPEIFSKWVGESLPYDEELFVVEDGVPKRVPIGNIVEEEREPMIFAFDHDGRVKLSKVSSLIRHKLSLGKRILEVKTISGRRIRVTDDHSLFSLTENGLGTVKTSDLVPGESYIAIPSRMPPVDFTIDGINLLKWLKDEDGVYVRGGGSYLREAVSRLGYEKAAMLLGISRKYLYDKLSSGIPVKASGFYRLMEEARVNYDPRRLTLSVRGSGNTLPAVIKVDEGLCTLLGVWVAEGDYQGYAVRIHCSNPEIVDTIRRICENMGLNVSEHDGTLSINSRLFRMFLEKVLKLEVGAENKRIPSLIFLLNNELKAAFLRGYYSGDGWISGNTHRYVIEVGTLSRELANDLLYILLYFGIVAKCREKREKNGKTSYIVEFMGVENFKKFMEVGFIDRVRNGKIKDYIASKKWSRSNQIPLIGKLKRLVLSVRHQWASSSTVGKGVLREVLKTVDPEKRLYPEYWRLVDGDIYLDKVTEIREVPYNGEYVYDISVNPSENFVAGFGGVFAHNSERAIREIFRKARMAAPAVVFFDEIDALVPPRGARFGDSGVSERVISQLLTELDGIETLENVVVLAATNRPDMVDPAVLRPGRFDRLIYVPPPDEKTRLQIFKIHTRNMPLDDDVSLERLAAITEGYTGADIAALCREAAMNAIRRNPETGGKVNMEDFRKVMEAIKPSITLDLDKWYRSIFQQQLKPAKPATPVT